MYAEFAQRVVKVNKQYTLNLWVIYLTNQQNHTRTQIKQSKREPGNISITKTYLYNFDPLKPHFYIVKLWFTGVYIIFLISAQKHRLWVLVRTASARRF